MPDLAVSSAGSTPGNPKDPPGPSAAGGRLKLFLLALGLLGAALVWFATSRYGVGVTPDSVVYISVARSLMRGEGFVDHAGVPLVMFPPLYPALLALAATILGKDPVSAARAVHAALFAAILFLSGLVFARYLHGPRGLSLLAAASVLVSIPLVPVQWLALSDPLFICFVLAYFLLMRHFFETDSVRSLALLSLSVALACLTRYAGVVLIAAGALSILLCAESRWQSRIKPAVLFAGLSALPLILWVVRNFLLSRTLFGPRSLSAHTYYDNLRAAGDNLLSWYLPGGASRSPLLLIVIAAAIMLAATLRFRNERPDVLAGLRRYGPILIFVLLYVAFLVASSETSFTQIIDNRYLSPIYVPVSILVLAGVAALLRPPSQPGFSRAASALLLGGIVLWLIYPATQTMQAAARQLDRGTWFTSRSWRDSQTMRYLRDHPSLAAECAIYSNAYDAVYLLTGMNAKSVPVKSSGPVIIADDSSLEGIWPPEGRACVVQFDEIDRRTYLFTPAELMAVTILEKRIPFDDGTIYVLSRK